MTAPPLDTSEPIQLMIRAKQGDQSAFNELHARYFFPVMRFFAKRVKGQEDAEDLAQTVFLKLYTSSAPFRDQAISPLAYLMTMARHTLVDYWRRRQPELVDSSVISEEEPMLAKRFLEDAMSARQLLAKAFVDLSPDERAVLQHKFFSGESTSEIAERLAKTEAAIRQIQCRALRKLRDLIPPIH